MEVTIDPYELDHVDDTTAALILQLQIAGIEEILVLEKAKGEMMKSRTPMLPQSFTKKNCKRDIPL